MFFQSVDYVVCADCGLSVAVNRTQQKQQRKEQRRRSSILSDGGDLCCGLPVERLCPHCAALEPTGALPMPALSASPRPMPWIAAVGLVTFDPAVGPRVGLMEPRLPLSGATERELAFLCFPDANYAASDAKQAHDFVLSLPASEVNCAAPPFAPTLERDIVSLMGSALFLQTRSPTAARGAHQSALFVLTHVPLVELSQALLEVLLDRVLQGPPGTGRFDAAHTNTSRVEGVLRRAVEDARGWAPFVPRHRFTHHVLDTRISIITPDAVAADWLGTAWCGGPMTMALVGPRCAAEDLLDLAEGAATTSTGGAGKGVASSKSAPGRLSAAQPEAVVLQQWIQCMGKLSLLPAPLRGRCVEVLVGSGCLRSSALRVAPQTTEPVPKTDDFLAGMRGLVRALRGCPPGTSQSMDGHGAAPVPDAASEAPPLPADLVVPDLLGLRSDVRTASLLLRSPSFYARPVVEAQNAQLQQLLAAAAQYLHTSTTTATFASAGAGTAATGLRSSLVARAPLDGLRLTEALWPHLSRTLKLWELVMAGESVVFAGGDVGVVSQAVLGVASLVSPLRFAGSLHPYLTINNHRSDAIVPNHTPALPTLLGVTNPYLAQRCSAWAHAVTFAPVSSRPPTSVDACKYVRAHHRGGKVAASDDPQRETIAFDPKDGFFSSRHFCVRSDHITDAINSHGAVSEDTVRKTVNELTEAFLAPLRDVVVSVLRLQRPFFVVCEAAAESTLLSPEAILEALKRVPNLPHAHFKSASDMIDLYRAFLATPTCRGYIHEISALVLREMLLACGALQDALLLDPCPQTRHRVLTALQGLLAAELDAPMGDVAYIGTLTRLLRNVCEVRLALLPL